MHLYLQEGVSESELREVLYYCGNVVTEYLYCNDNNEGNDGTDELINYFGAYIYDYLF